jgi:peptidoglycan hydrolase CwlO-like protein
MNNWLLPTLTIVLPVISSAVTWGVSRRQRNNSFIANLQQSIDLLSEKYTKALNELIMLREENNDLKAMQHELLCSLRRLEAENKELKVVIDGMNLKINKLKTVSRAK